ncbi:MAG: formate--tetrahydrofolate ligase, partial [Thermoanaerobaculia bacterium]
GAVGAIGAMMALLADAMMPNLVQTTEETPAFVHCGPFANIAHGTSSIVSQKMALKLSDYVVNETGFAADLGAEKYFDIVMRSSGIRPSAAVIIATAKAIRFHGSRHDSLPINSREALIVGFANLRKHIENVQKYGVPVVVAVNRFDDDTEDDLKAIAKFCDARGVPSAVSDVYAKGGEGAMDLAHAVVAAADTANLEVVQPLYELHETYEEKIGRIAREIYGASGVYFESVAAKKMKNFVARGFDHLPVCVAKTQSSLSDDPKVLGAPTGWTLTITDANISAGAGFLVVIAGNMMLMPGLPKRPHACDVDLSAEGAIVGVK